MEKQHVWSKAGQDASPLSTSATAALLIVKDFEMYTACLQCLGAMAAEFLGTESGNCGIKWERKTEMPFLVGPVVKPEFPEVFSMKEF